MAGVVAIGAGLAGALLYLVARQPGVVALVLTRLGPLPIMIAALGFGARVGLGAAVVGTLTVAAAALLPGLPHLDTADFSAAGLDGGFFALGEGLPACWLGYLVIAPHPRLIGAAKPAEATPARRLGAIIVWAILASILIVGFALVANSLDAGSYAAMVTRLAERVAPLVQSLVGSGQELPRGVDVDLLARLVAEAAWPAVAGASLVTFLVDLWIAARVVQISNRLPFVWPNIPRDLKIPRFVALVFAVALGVCFAGGLTGALAIVAATTIAVAFAMQGLATVHDLTRDRSYRLPLLCLIYLLVGVLMPWPLAAFAVIGLFEAGFSLRERKAARPR
jgi:hypothetical protein